VKKTIASNGFTILLKAFLSIFKKKEISTALERNLSFRNSATQTSTFSINPKLEDDIEALARVLTNIMVIGIEKRRNCIHYAENGLCTKMVFETQIPNIALVRKGNAWYIEVSKHPEICAVCPFWKSKEKQ